MDEVVVTEIRTPFHARNQHVSTVKEKVLESAIITFSKILQCNIDDRIRTAKKNLAEHEILASDKSLS